MCKERNHKTADWRRNGKHFQKFQSEEIVEQLGHVYSAILSESAQRAIALKNLHARIRGSNKQASRLFKNIQAQNSKIDKLIKEFNELSQQLPPPYTPPPLEKSAFYAQEEQNSAPAEDPTDALWKIEMLRSELMDHENSPPSDVIWPYSAAVRFGIDAMFRRDRAKEEMHMVEMEWDRLVRFTTRRTNILLACHVDPSPAIRKLFDLDIFLGMLWDEVRSLYSIKNASSLLGEQRFECPEVDELIASCNAKLEEFFQRRDAGFDPTEFEEQMKELEEQLHEDDFEDGVKKGDDIDDGWQEFDGDALMEAFDRAESYMGLDT
ncbi:hypothetical protein BJ508DRAFT_308182 [Ascobolus immersus RN42]|uniref:Uncharacterized protein n=1 Tax=Ascobolus immersus RN42 TaxID=1160509 RepID=A0A3N4I0S6_ASCIM|nr:hypothetical protein BJ508DRAFT_308182 [Ascobolus immersus RN42]